MINQKQTRQLISRQQQSKQAIFKAIADPTRRTIIGMLAEQSLSVNEIAQNFDMSRPAIAKHLVVLKDGNIITVEKQGRERINSLCPQSLKSVADWVSQYNRFWDEKLNNLKSAIEEDT